MWNLPLQCDRRASSLSRELDKLVTDKVALLRLRAFDAGENGPDCWKELITVHWMELWRSDRQRKYLPRRKTRESV